MTWANYLIFAPFAWIAWLVARAIIDPSRVRHPKSEPRFERDSVGAAAGGENMVSHASFGAGNCHDAGDGGCDGGD
ncbi:hypothetical protein [Sphingomonas sp. LM7]|uniref:hypothetical protein n=1 Tax=Sphingomonas sp. LM7 TaxID=1938607 RepID=UPI000983DDA6|nr:hypothetical protein [Sphingomonas sp. LM7]AQR73935.1 hypothetical protein BXU08_10000 [Sphingomonas sp. LM7]